MALRLGGRIIVLPPRQDVLRTRIPCHLSAEPFSFPHTHDSQLVRVGLYGHTFRPLYPHIWALLVVFLSFSGHSERCFFVGLSTVYRFALSIFIHVSRLGILV